MDDKADRLRRRREQERRRRALESAEQRELRLSRRREQERARRAERSSAQRDRLARQRRDGLARETDEQREARLQRVRDNQTQTLNDETIEEREKRLQLLRDNQNQRLATESVEERERRLQLLSDNQRQRLANETEEDRTIRLQRLQANRSQQLVVEDEDEIERRRQDNRERQRRHRELELLNATTALSRAQAKMAIFHAKLANLEMSVCDICLERSHTKKTQLQGTQRICTRCKRDKNTPKIYSSDNKMDPGPVPTELLGLTQVEEMLISAVMPMMSIYRLPYGQYGYSGHVINFPQDVLSFARTLPRLPSQLDVVVVRKQGVDQTHRDFRVRRTVVEQALRYLVTHNKYYRANDVRIDEEALLLLPEDGSLCDFDPVVLETPDATDGDDNSSTTDIPPSGGELSTENDDEIVRSFVPHVTRSLTEQETVRQIVQPQPTRDQSQNSSTLMWPSIGGRPINEFDTEGYFSCAFPTLYPTGAADFHDARQRNVTIGNYFKHLMLYDDGRFAKHPRFRFFALNTEMRWRAIQAGRVYVRQHPGDAHLSVDALRDMVGREGECFSNRVLHYAASLRGTKQYWFRQRNQLMAMVDTLGLPTIFFTHSAADNHWPELARLICPSGSDSRAERSAADNPATADWFFYHRIEMFIEAFYVGVLGAKDYWLRFEWQHRGSPHVHGLAWLPDAPDADKLLSTTDETELQALKDEMIHYADTLISTCNPAVLPDGSNLADAPYPKTDPHVCNTAYSDVTDFEEDLADLVATCQRHTRCSPAYCLRTKNGQQYCRFGYPKPLQANTAIVLEDEPTMLTARNDGMINSFNPIQLSSWRANVDMQYIVSRRRVLEYCTKYVTKSEPRSQSLRELFAKLAQSLKEGNTSLQMVQKLLINCVGERDFSAQETCHLLLQLPMFKSSREFTILSLDGSRTLYSELVDGQNATAPSIVDHYCARPSTEQFERMTLLNFTQNYSLPKSLGEQPKRRKKMVVVIPRPYCSSDPNGPKYEQYCRQMLMQHKCFRNMADLLSGHETYADAYAAFLINATIQPSLQEDLQRLQQQQHEPEPSDEEEQTGETENVSSAARPNDTEDWMHICQNRPGFQQPNSRANSEDFDWTLAAQSYPNLREAPSFIAQQQQASNIDPTFTTTAKPELLCGKQLHVYNIISEHFQSANESPIRMIISGTAGTGKSYLIHCLRLLLQDCVSVAAPTGVAAFNIAGHTLHSLLSLPTKGDFKDLEGDRLHKLQQSLSAVKYIIIDEMSMVGRKTFAQVDRRLRQAFPHRSQEVFGGCSCLLFGDFGQLPPVMDQPLYTTHSKSELSDQGMTAYQSFQSAVVLDQIIRQAGDDPDQRRFRDLLLRLRDGETTVDDWKILMRRTPTKAQNLSSFQTALHLYPTVEAAVDHNVSKLNDSGRPVAIIKAVHTGGACAFKAPADDAGGLEAVTCLADTARVMLTSNLWVEFGLVNGAMGTVESICYQTGGPPSLPTAIMVRFDKYSGPTFTNGVVPITPIRRCWSSSGMQCSRLQLPLKLAWAVTIHKSQGLTLDKAVIDVGKKEFSSGLTFVACSRVRHLEDLLFSPPFNFQRLSTMSSSRHLLTRKAEDQRLKTLPLVQRQDNGLEEQESS